MSKQYVLNADGSKTEIKAIPVMTLEEMREAGAAKMANPEFVAQKIAEAKKKAE
jgi:hypothetical protein